MFLWITPGGLQSYLSGECFSCIQLVSSVRTSCTRRSVCVLCVNRSSCFVFSRWRAYRSGFDSFWRRAFCLVAVSWPLVVVPARRWCAASVTPLSVSAWRFYVFVFCRRPGVIVRTRVYSSIYVSCFALSHVALFHLYVFYFCCTYLFDRVSAVMLYDWLVYSLWLTFVYAFIER